MIKTITVNQAYKLANYENIDDLTYVDYVCDLKAVEVIFSKNNQLYAFVYYNREPDDKEVTSIDGYEVFLDQYNKREIEVHPVKKIIKQVARYIKED